MTELDRALHATVLKREAVKEQEYREQRLKDEDAAKARFGSTDMSKAALRKVIDSDRRMYYRTEELNDKLYIHYKGWKEIVGLEGWTGLRALYAECNAFSVIQGLQNCRQLRSLFLSENCIRKIEGLDNCPELWSINLSNNFIERIEGLSKCRKLNTLIIAKNKIGLGGMDDVTELLDTTISTLDIQDNRIWDPDIVPEVLARMEDLRVLYLKGNPCSKKVPNYRKGITVYCVDLKYLDDRPVFPEDRRASEAFNRGGLDEERAERRRIKEEANAAADRNMRAFQDMVQRARDEGREKKAMRLEDKYSDDTDPVESMEKRMQRQQDQWKKDNAEGLRDENKERAEACLRSERQAKAAAGAGEGSGSGTEGTDTDAPVGAAEATDGPVAKALPVAEEATAATRSALAAVANEDPMADHRKLVYEDIWDDLPKASAAAPATSKSTAGPVAASIREAVGTTQEKQRPAAFAPPPRTSGGGAAATAVAAVAKVPPPPGAAVAVGSQSPVAELDEMD